MISTAVIMASGMGTRFGQFTEKIPKGFVEFGGIPMVERSIQTLIDSGIKKIIIGTGYKKESYETLARKYPQIKCVYSTRYAETNSMYTLWNCREEIGDDDFLLLESDLVYEKKAITSLIDCMSPDVMLITPITKFQDQYYVEFNDFRVLTNCSVCKEDLSAKGELVGIHKLSNRFYRKMCDEYSTIVEEKPKLGYEYELLSMSQNSFPVFVLEIAHLKWYEIDDVNDLRYAERNILPYLHNKVTRNILLNPGPATTTDSVKYSQIVPDICPREKEFAGLMKGLRSDLLKVVHAPEDEYTSVLFCGSGTINIDICINSLVPEGKKILVVNNGAYNTRAVEVCEMYHIPHINLKFSVYEQPKLDEVEKTLKENPDVAVVYCCHHETGTGILNPIREIGALSHQYGAIFISDTTSTLGMIPLDVVKDNVDFYMASAQKGLMAMSGLSFIIGKTDIIKDSKNYPTRSYYCNLYLQYEYFEKTGEMHFTPPVQTIYATIQALKEYFEVGEEAKFARHRRVYEAIHEGLDELGFKTIIPREIESGLVVSVLYPEDTNWDFEKVHDYCYERGFTIYPGKISTTNTFRLCALGNIDVQDVKDFFVVMKDALCEFNISL